MPVIRGPIKKPTLSDGERRVLLERLESELAGKKPVSGNVAWEIPLIFEIPLERLDGPSDRMDVFVVWDSFQNLRSDERTALILEAYHDRADQIVQALGVTRQEASDQCLLPYDVTSLILDDDIDTNEVNQAKLEEGGFSVSQDKVVLRFPTRSMAEAAARRLLAKFRGINWNVEQLQ